MNDPDHIIQTHFDELIAQYPNLRLAGEQDSWIIEGLLTFSASYEEITIQDSFDIEVILPDDYPKNCPTVKETGSRIPPDFHKLFDGSLCLGASFEIRKKFKENPTLLGFITDLVIPYLYSYCYWKQHGLLPYGELSHGFKGITEYYLDFFNVNSELTVLNLLIILATDNYRGHLKCPCGSGHIIRHCHGNILLKCKDIQSWQAFAYDLLSIFLYMKNNKISLSAEIHEKLIQCHKKLSHFKKKV